MSTSSEHIVQTPKRKTVVVIGAGPAGLTAARLLAQGGVPVTVLESDPVYVGGISRTIEYHGYRFDIGGHRFFSKSEQIEALWSEILPDGFLVRPRLSRIYYGGRFFDYPLRPLKALRTLGPLQATACVASYARARLQPHPHPASFEDWVVNRFGRRLFDVFFRTYTEKVWGMPCAEISADWAVQRIGSLSLGSALLPEWVTNPARRRRRAAKTLTQTFRYPRLGPGMLWEACAQSVQDFGGTIRLGRHVRACHWRSDQGQWTIEHVGPDGSVASTTATDVISSAPLADLIGCLAPNPGRGARQAASDLRYRDFLTVGLIIDRRLRFEDQWIYVHDPSVRVARIQNYRAWSPDMVPDEATSSLGLEYFCREHDDLWEQRDDALVRLAWEELQRIGLAPGARFIDGHVVRQRRAYPVYDAAYAANVSRIRTDLDARFPTLHLVGRNGMHKYNNQDHAMMTGLLAAENILLGRRAFDVWRVNADAEYLEDGSTSGLALRVVPTRVRAASATDTRRSI
jgi:protoporphyrinogen oxidase